MAHVHNVAAMRELIRRESELLTQQTVTSLGKLDVHYLKVGTVLIHLGYDAEFAELFAEAIRPDP